MAFVAVPWRDERVLACDRDVLVVDKPPGIAVHGGDEISKDDVVSRLAAWLESRAEDRYLGVHQRLDKDASGVLFFTRRRELNPAVARDMEQHAAKKIYVAGVTGARLADQGVLEHRLRHGRDRVTRVVERGGQLARARYRILRRCGPRALVEISAETGRTHQLRSQLAAEGCPIGGDHAYGGEPALRLMLHARALELPSLRWRFEAPMPAVLTRWLEGQVTPFDAESLADALCLRWPLFGRADAFRLCNGAGDGLPGVVVDRYGDFAVLSLDDPSSQDPEAVAATLVALGARGVYLKIHERRDLRSADLATLAPHGPIAGQPCPDEIVVREGELRFGVRLAEGFSTGLFVDQRENRVLVARLAQGRRVLNLFSYTCSFSVAAVQGGAAEVVSVDLSQPALDRGRHAFELNGLDPSRHRFIHADAVEWLRRARKKNERWAIIVLDPPTFGTRSKRTTFDAESDYARVAADALVLLEPEGKLLAVTNRRKTSQARLRKMLHEAAHIAQRRISQMKDLHPPLDCPPGPEGPAAKSVLVTVE